VERRISMTHRATLSLVAIAIFLLATSAQAERSVVLVTNKSCPMQAISMLDVRKAYYGVAVSYKEVSIRAFRLNNDDALNQVFYQSVVSISEKSYERRLLSMLLKYGTPRPQEHDDVEALVAAISRTDCGIAYMWQSDAAAHDVLKTLRVLWKEN
jgi:hypothetical protein